MSRLWTSAVFNKTCHICGKEFQTKANNAKHCSRECKLESQRRRRTASLGPLKAFSRTCPQCGGSFETRSANKKYCSQECYRLATNERKKAERSKLQKRTQMKESEKGLCSVCGADDVPVSECSECGYLCCVECHDGSGVCSICSGDPIVLALVSAV